MDAYVRDFEIEKINNHIAEDIRECKNVLIKAKGKDFKLFHNNIRSLAKNIDELNVVLTGFDDPFDCIVLTETFNLHSTDIYNIPGYDLIYNQGDLNKNDGVLIYIKSEFNYSHEIIQLGRIKAIKLNILYATNTIQIIAIYRSPSLCALDFNSHLGRYLNSLKSYKDIELIVGDMNLDILDNNEYCQEYLNILAEQGYISAINTYTRVQANSKTCLDHIFLKTNIPRNNFVPVVLQVQITDHYPVLIQFCFCNDIQNTVYKNRYKQYIDYKKLNEELSFETWLDLYSELNIDIAVDMFIDKLKLYIERCTKKYKIKRQDIKRSPWITNGILKSINTKDELFNRVKRNPRDSDILNKYKKYRNKLNELTKKTKMKYYKSEITKNINCPKNIWNCVRTISNPNNNDYITDIKNIADEEGVIITNKKEISNKFCNYFTEIGQKLASKIETNQNINFPRTIIQNSIYLEHTNELEVKTIIQNLKQKKAPGIDTFKAETLKNIVTHIVKPITYIINKSLDDGIFPSAFKIAVIKPLHKSGDKLQISNYRPISLLSNLAKIFEKILKDRITKFMNKYNIMSQKQYGFREGSSTQDAIVDLVTNIHKAVDAGEPSLCIFIDLAKAFDTVSHQDLLVVLENVGVRGLAHDLMKSYLTGRKQRVKIENFMSDEKTITHGVPQGTVLGPMLFSLYVNDLFKLNITGNIISFADDTAVFYKDITWLHLKKQVENDFGTIVNFFKSKLLTINIKKTNFLSFTSYSNNMPTFSKLQVKCEGQNVEIISAKNVKYLGIIIDPHLRWNEHINNLVKKLRSLLTKFTYFKKFFDINHLKLMYTALVESHLVYGIVAWGSATKSCLKSLEVIQKWILRIMFDKSRMYPGNSLYNDTKIYDIRQLYCKCLLVYQYKLKSSIHLIEHLYNTRYKDDSIPIPRAQKTIGQRSFYYLGPKIYNELPKEIKKLNSLYSFKKEIKKWINHQPRYLIHQLIDIKNNYNF